MQLTKLLVADRAVSPVIGVVLVIAITVVLAGIIGTSVLGLGQNVQSAPQTNFEFDFDRDGTSVNVTHSGGDRLDEDNAGAVDVTTGVGEYDWLGNASADAGDGAITASESIDDLPYASGEQVRVVWTSSSGDSTATLGVERAPS